MRAKLPWHSLLSKADLAHIWGICAVSVDEREGLARVEDFTL